MQKSKNNAYNLKEKGRLLARSISQTDVLYYTRSYFPLTVLFDMDMVAERFDPSFKRGAEMKAHLVEKGSDRRKGKRTFV